MTCCKTQSTNKCLF